MELINKSLDIGTIHYATTYIAYPFNPYSNLEQHRT
jgi:hypothetical protein